MTTRLTFPASMFSVACQRCGSTLRKSADSCPNCGADRAAAFGEDRTRTARGLDTSSERKERGGLFKPAGAVGTAAGPALAAAAPAGGTMPSTTDTPAKLQITLAAPGSPEVDPDVLPNSDGWNRRKTVIASVCALALFAGGAAYLMHDGSADSTADDESTPSTQHSAFGAIDSRSATSSLGAALPGVSGATSTTERRPAADAHPMSIADTVQSARRAMEQHDLTAARARLKSIATAQQSRPDVQHLKDELTQREVERDAALQLARACEKTSAWACVQQNAGEALGFDGSNTESQAMLERVITHAGWLAGTSPAGAKKKSAADAVTNAPAVASTAPSPATQPAAIPAPAPAKVVAAKPATAPVQAQTPPEAQTPKQTAVATRAPAVTPPETARAAVTESRAASVRESRRSSSYGRNAPSSAMADVTVIPAPAISPPLLPTTSTNPVSTAARATTTSVASSATVTTAAATHTPVTPLASSYAPASAPTTIAPAAVHVATPAPTVTTSTTSPTVSHAATVIPTPAAALATTNTMTTTTTAPAPAPLPATATRTATVASTTPGSTGATETRPATRPPMPDAQNADELERAIKQFGWSGGDSMPKQTR